MKNNQPRKTEDARSDEMVMLDYIDDEIAKGVYQIACILHKYHLIGFYMGNYTQSLKIKDFDTQRNVLQIYKNVRDSADFTPQDKNTLTSLVHRLRLLNGWAQRLSQGETVDKLVCDTTKPTQSAQEQGKSK